jgi:hypothetical protein
MSTTRTGVVNHANAAMNGATTGAHEAVVPERQTLRDHLAEQHEERRQEDDVEPLLVGREVEQDAGRDRGEQHVHGLVPDEDRGERAPRIGQETIDGASFAQAVSPIAELRAVSLLETEERRLGSRRRAPRGRPARGRPATPSGIGDRADAHGHAHGGEEDDRSNHSPTRNARSAPAATRVP